MISDDLVKAIGRHAPPLSEALAHVYEEHSRQAVAKTARIVFGRRNCLEEAKWGIIFGSKIGEEVKRALARLIAHRGGRALDPVKGRRCEAYLASQGVRWGPPHDTATFPYYVLLVGSPNDPDLPWDFQEELSLQCAVGRLDFASDPLDASSNNTPVALEAFTHYVEGVIAGEAMASARRAVRLFPVVGPDDPATDAARQFLMSPLWSSLREHKYFEINDLLPEPADTCLENWRALLSASVASLFVSSSHGLERPSFWPANQYQGSLIMRDGYSSLPASAAEDTQALRGVFTGSEQAGRLEGCGFISFACHSGGSHCESEGEMATTGKFVRQSESDRSSILAKNLLGRAGGAASFLVAHVDRVHSLSFLTMDGLDYHQHFAALILRLMAGWRVGPAFEDSIIPWRETAFRSYRKLSPYGGTTDPRERELALNVLNYLDAKNFVILGDPAARLGGPTFLPSPDE